MIPPDLEELKTKGQGMGYYRFGRWPRVCYRCGHIVDKYHVKEWLPGEFSYSYRHYNGECIRWDRANEQWIKPNGSYV